MKRRPFGRTGREVGEVGLGCWQLGGSWGPAMDERQAIEILRIAVERGVDFFDTADVYGAGRSETLIGEFLRSLPDGGRDIFVATKLGRRNYPGPYSREVFRQHTEDSLRRLQRDRLDLTQLHCVPTEELRRGEVFEWLRELQRDGLITHFGASVESMEEAKICLQQDGLASLQVIFNVFRQKPIDELLDTAKAKGVAIIVRLPLASGLLSGRFDRSTRFDAGDHRNFNRDGAAFNVGETFAGLPYEKAVELTDELKPMVPAGQNMAPWAMRWILDHDAVSVVIPGASRPSQVESNIAASDMASLPREQHEKLRLWYRERVREHIRGPY